MRNRKSRRNAQGTAKGLGGASGKHIEVLGESKWRLKRSVDRTCRLYF